MPEAAATATGKIRLWEKLEIIVGEGSNAGRYVARLEDYRQDTLVIDAPEFVSGSSLLHNGADCTVVFTREDASYQFSSTITVVEQKGRRTFLLQAPKRLRRVQRRQFVRIDLRRRVGLALLGRRGSLVQTVENIAWHQTMTVNISGGGFFIEVPVPVQVGDLLLVKAEFFPEIGMPIAVTAVVRRTMATDQGLRAGIELLRNDQLSQFFDGAGMRMLPESVTFFDQMMQNKLVNYVFREQVKLRQKGLL